MSNKSTTLPAATIDINRVPLAIFASGAGSNAEAIIHYTCRTAASYRVALLVSNNSQCGAIQIAQMFDIPTVHISLQTHPNPDEYAAYLQRVLGEHHIEMIALAGYMKKLPESVIAAFSANGRSRIFNIHPSLLPKFGGLGMYGLRVHEAVLAAGETETGCTVHEVDGEYDAGTIIAQKHIPVLNGDTPERLAHRVLECEHTLYPDVLQEKAGETLTVRFETNSLKQMS
jgi:phosphoribosylglycinamide formyltransferase 1